MTLTAGQRRYLNKQGTGIKARAMQERRGVMQKPDTVYYDEYGFVMTPEQHDALLENVSAIEREREAGYSQVSSAQSKLNSYKSKKKSLDDYYKEFEKDFADVEVYSTDPQTGEHTLLSTHRLPVGVIKELSVKGNKNYLEKIFDPETNKLIYRGAADTNETTSDKFADVGDYYSNQMKQYEKQVRSAFDKKIKPQVDKNNSTIDSQVSQAQDSIDAARTSLDAGRAADTAVLQRERDLYEDKIKSARRVAEGLR